VTPRSPEVSVVVASHRREERLPLLLDALAEQTLARDRLEVVVAHTYEPTTAERILGGHELTRSSVLQQVRVGSGAIPPAVQRNAALRLASAPLVAFTDDDCRPEPDWLERLLAVAHANPGQIVQGATRPDPREAATLAALYVHTMGVDPPGQGWPTANILYERALIDRLGGFDERAVTGEDVDLAVRAQRTGATVIAAPNAIVNHAVVELSLVEKLRYDSKWQHLAYVVKKNPELRARCGLGIFWEDRHLRAAVALAGLAGSRRRRWALAALVPYYLGEMNHFGESPRARARVIKRLPQLWLIDMAELGWFALGSLRYRTLLL
jgi:GT2 family glycosyltransferase